MELSKQDSWTRALLVRRSIEEKPEYAYYLCYAPAGKDKIEALVRVAGERWKIEQCFATAKGECGLDHYEERHWQGWYRHITLSMFAHAVLFVLRARKKKLSKRRCGSAYPNCATCSKECCGADGTALKICCIGPSGEDDINSEPCPAAIESAVQRCQRSIYNCSTSGHRRRGCGRRRNQNLAEVRLSYGVLRRHLGHAPADRTPPRQYPGPGASTGSHARGGLARQGHRCES